MTNACNIHGSVCGFWRILFLLVTVCCASFTVAEAKVYIDISSPASKKLPIAVQEFSGPFGEEISDTIRDDLDFTGLFAYIDKNAHIETVSQPFNPKNWTPLGAEAVVKGSAREGQEIVVSVTLYDVFEGKEILRKEYKAAKGLIRPVSHAIANDIYHALTGEAGIFRSRIAFVGDTRGEKSLYLMDWDGHRVTKTGLQGNIILSPRWARDGSRLLYSLERNRQWGIYLLDFTSMVERKVFSAKGTNMAGDFYPDGNDIIISSSRDGTPDLYSVEIKSGAATKLTSSYGIDVSPSVSPDGRYIAFVSDRGGSPQVYTMRRDGTEVKRVTFEGAYNTSPAWSPKGDKLVFSGRRGTNQIFTVSPDGTDLMQLTTSGNNEEPSFSPDGRYITFSSDRDGVKGVYIMRANGESQKRVTPRSIRAYNPRWSPK